MKLFVLLYLKIRALCENLHITTKDTKSTKFERNFDESPYLRGLRELRGENFRFLWLRLSCAGLFVVTNVRPRMNGQAHEDSILGSITFLFFRIRERLFENCQHRLHLRPFDPAVEVEIVDSRGAAVLRLYVVFRNIDAQ